MALPADDQSADRLDKPHWTDRLAHDFMELSWGWTRQRAISVALRQEKNGGQHAGKPFASAPAWELYAQSRRRLFSALSPVARPLAQETTSLRWKGMWKICVPVAGSVNVAVSGTGAKPSARSTMTNNVDKLQFWYLGFLYTAPVRTDLTFMSWPLH